jgi:malate synthase
VSQQINVRGERDEVILSDEALDFVAGLHRTFDGRRRELLATRPERHRLIESGELPDFLTQTKDVREGDWRVASAPDDLQDRRTEITGPTDRKMIINALNSGAKVFMADFEDSNSPTWDNMVTGQRNLIDAIERTIDFTSPEGKSYALAEDTATLVVRPRGWHLPERHLEIDGTQVSGSLFDFGLFFWHCAQRLLDRGSGPYLYLPKLENHLEARLWNDVFSNAEDAVGLEHGTIKATVLIEHVLAAFEMEEILYELRDRSVALNAGRWDYIFSIIKEFGDRDDFVLPDRNQVTMRVPFMRAYTELLVSTCHKREAHALGGMAAFIPSRRDEQVNATAIAKVREDKQLEAGSGFDGTWIAHPDLVPIAQEVFDEELGERPNQVSKKRDDVSVEAGELLDMRVPDGSVTEEGLRNNVSVGIQYLESWLRGTGAAAIFNLMEDAATSEISRTQIWQWIATGTKLDDGRQVTKDLVRTIEEEELAKIRDARGADAFDSGRFEEAREIFEQVALSEELAEFLTLPAYERLA